jgi:predicted TPR repeat methyltransferase
MDTAAVAALDSALSRKDYPALHDVVESLRERYAASAHFSYWEGVLALRQGHADKALPLLESAANRAVGVSAPRYELGNALMALGRAKDAALVYETAILANQKFVGAWMNLGAARLRLGDIARAERAYTTAMALDASHIEIWLGLAKLHERAGHPERAVELMEETRRRFGADLDRDADLLRLLSATGRENSAIELLHQILEYAPNNAVATHLLAAKTGGTPSRAADGYLREVFDSYAQTYDEHMTKVLNYNGYSLIAQALRAVLPAPASILDLGCGTGLLAAELPGYTLTGVDLSQPMLQIAETRGYATLHCQEIGAFLAATAERRFEGICACETLVYFGDLTATFAAAARVLSPAGIVCVNVETDALVQTFAVQSNGRYVHARRYLEDCCARAGLKVLQLHAFTPRKEGASAISGLMLLAQRT